VELVVGADAAAHFDSISDPGFHRPEPIGQYQCVAVVVILSGESHTTANTSVPVTAARNPVFNRVDIVSKDSDPTPIGVSGDLASSYR
jgi:hypothetical protein